MRIYGKGPAISPTIIAHPIFSIDSADREFAKFVLRQCLAMHLPRQVGEPITPFSDKVIPAVSPIAELQFLGPREFASIKQIELLRPTGLIKYNLSEVTPSKGLRMILEMSIGTQNITKVLDVPQLSLPALAESPPSIPHPIKLRNEMALLIKKASYAEEFGRISELIGFVGKGQRSITISVGLPPAEKGVRKSIEQKERMELMSNSLGDDRQAQIPKITEREAYGIALDYILFELGDRFGYRAPAVLKRGKTPRWLVTIIYPTEKSEAGDWKYFEGGILEIDAMTGVILNELTSKEVIEHARAAART